MHTSVVFYDAVKMKWIVQYAKKLCYEQSGIVPTEFNGIPDVNLVLLEKHL